MPAQTLNAILDQLYYSSTSESDKGSKFERMLKRYLQLEPKFADQFSGSSRTRVKSPVVV